MKIEEWNAIPKDKETDAAALENDLCTLIDGVAFLIQRKGNINNIICKRIEKSSEPLIKTFFKFRIFCKQNAIQYIRVEGGNTHTYNILKLMRKTAPSSCGLVKAEKESEELNKVVYYVKTY